MSEPLLIALIALVAGFLGAMLQAISARALDRGKFEREAKWNLYTSYFVTLGELTFSDRDTGRHENALATMAQIRGRMGVIGSPEVIRAVGRVFGFPDLRSPEAQAAMSVVLEAMRRDVGQKASGLNDAALQQLMFGSRETQP